MSELPTTIIPESWVWSRIQDVATTATGGTPSRTVKDYFGGTIPWVKSGELGDGHVYEAEETLSELGLNSSNAKLFPKGTLCIALYGATVGKLGILEVDAATNQAVCGIFLPDAIHRDFVFHYLASIRRHLIEQGKGGAQSNISNGLVRQTWIPIAPENEQRRIVAKIEELFSDLDAGVAALERAKANLKRYRAAVLKAAVEGKLTEEWRATHPAKEPASALLARILKERRQKWEADQLAKFAAAGKEPPKNWKEKYVEPSPPVTTGLPELPEGWCWVAFGQVARFQNGRAFPSNEYASEGVRLLRPGNLFANGEVRWTEKNSRFMPPEWADTCPTYIVRGDELVMNLTAQSLADEFLGRICLTSPDECCLLNQRLARITPLDGLKRQFTLYLLKSAVFRKFVNGLNTGSLIEHMFTSQLETCCLPLAPLAEQDQIVAEVAERLSQIAAAETIIEHGLIRASRLRQSILKQAFEGKLVPQDRKDEPASVLLERLRANQRAYEGNGKANASSRTRGRRAKT